MDEELDDRLEVEAAKTGNSKAALIRDAVAKFFGQADTSDPVDDLIGAYDGPAGESVDDVAYR